MLYKQLAEVYEKLEKTPAKLAKADIIAKVLKKTPTKLLPKVVLLLSGRVFPAWSEHELGVANQLMIKAISKASGVKNTEIIKKFRQTGDLGLTAEYVLLKRVQRSLISKKLTVDKIFDSLQKIASQTGKGSQERKLALIAELLISAKKKESVYIVRTVLEELRIGVAEGIVRDSIAKAFKVDKKVVENAWFLDQDYGEIAKIAKAKGEKGLKKVKIQLGKPISVLLAEKSPSLKDALEEYDKLAIEMKFDGARAQIHKKGDKFWLYTRRLENVTNQFPDVIEMCKKSLKAKNCIVEGEIQGIDHKTNKPLPFQRLSERIKRKYEIHNIMKKTPVKLTLFDIVYLNGKMLFNQSFENRRKLLEKVIKPISGKFQLAEQLTTKDLKNADKFYKKALAAGQEGVMVKNLEAYYQPGRRVAGGWLKVKPTLETLDLVIMGAQHGRGKRAGWLGSFIIGCRDPSTGKFLECGMMGTGVKEKKTNPEDVTFKDLTKMLKPYIESEKAHQVKIKPKIVIEVAYEEIQKSPTYASGFALRFPRFQRIRVEKGPKDADSLNRIERIFKMQKGKKAR